MFRPPVNHAMRSLDRSFFQKSVSLAAAKVYDIKRISELRSSLSKELLKQDRISPITRDSSDKNAKSLLLRPDIAAEDSSTWTNKLQELVQQKVISIHPYKLELNYDYWNHEEIMEAIIPPQGHEEQPSGYNMVGHIAHLNLRAHYLPYKNLIAQILLDKAPGINTVINKIDDVGTANEYRTFNYEVLAGDPNLNVEIRQSDCVFRFDYSKVYYNTKLNTEHQRLVDLFQLGETVCDVMAGVGPFAVPAGKKKVFVWANDLNPDSFTSLKDAIAVNKVSEFVRPFNEDGYQFIRKSAQQLLSQSRSVTIKPKLSRHAAKSDVSPPPKLFQEPTIFSHYVMNLPASAITFLPAFIGLYWGQEQLFTPAADNRLPLIHVHCFSTKSDDSKAEGKKICAEISGQLKYKIDVGDHEMRIHRVRDVAPNKVMFCASFRLPADVAFRSQHATDMAGQNPNEDL